MGKKYIIELEDYAFRSAGTDEALWRVKGFNSLLFDQNGLSRLTEYAEIGCDSNLTAVYDVLAVIQQIKPRSKAIERIERGVYEQP